MKLKRVAEDVERDLREDQQRIEQMVQIVQAQVTFQSLPPPLALQ